MEDQGKAFGYFALFSEIGLVLFVTTFGGLLAGRWLDQQLGTNPALVITGFLLGILIVKEVITGVMSLISIGKTGRVDGAQWHGKLTTVLLYAMIVDRIVPWLFSVLLTLACAGMMVFSMVMYWKRNRDSIREAT